jgi:hypothetical protein
MPNVAIVRPTATANRLHDFLEPVAFFVGETDMPAVGVNSGVDELGSARADALQPCEVRQAWSTSGRPPVERDRAMFPAEDVIGGLGKVAVQQRLG